MSSVRLREMERSDIPVVDRMLAPVGRGEFNDFGDRPPGSVAGVFEADLVSTAERGMLVVELVPERQVIGMVTWTPVQHGPNPESRAWNIGIALLPEARGHGWGAPAQRATAQHLFATTGVNRVEASADVENVREHRALEKAGFTREGVLRGAQHRRGRWHDIVLYSLLRSDLGDL